MKISVRIPATSANLGPGFDCVGLALDLWNEFELSFAASETTRDYKHIEISVDIIGEGAGRLPRTKAHLVAQVMLKELEHLQCPAPTIMHLVCRNNVPAGSGLGSSSTAVLGGLMLANRIQDWGSGMKDEELGTRDSKDLQSLTPNSQPPILNRAIELEGHGDNVAPAYLGGLIVVSPTAPMGSHDYLTQRIAIAPQKVVVCVPDFHFLTSTARAAVPQQFSRSDMIFNIGRAILVIEALRNADYALLGRAMDDRLHEPYRLPLIPGAVAAKAAALAQGASAVAMSGAGPGLIAFTTINHHAIGAAFVAAFAEANLNARYWVLDTLEHGATVEMTNYNTSAKNQTLEAILGR
ncbi:MAG: homoserine kinase [Chloroflexota bacterium]|jgi:homoserine kinase|nr:homoserine kinase [Chloroflexota bacterium]